MRPACQKGSPFRAQAGTTNHIYISRSSTFSERNKFIQLIHPIKGVLGTLSPVSQLIVPAKLLSVDLFSGDSIFKVFMIGEKKHLSYYPVKVSDMPVSD